jgi:hypothetical protein
MGSVISHLRLNAICPSMKDVPRPASRSATCCAGEASSVDGQCARFSRAKGSGGGEVVRPPAAQCRPRRPGSDCRQAPRSRRWEREGSAGRGRVRIPGDVPGSSRCARRKGNSRALSVRAPRCMAMVALGACSRSRRLSVSRSRPPKHRPTQGSSTSPAEEPGAGCKREPRIGGGKPSIAILGSCCHASELYLTRRKVSARLIFLFPGPAPGIGRVAHRAALEPNRVGIAGISSPHSSCESSSRRA